MSALFWSVMRLPGLWLLLPAGALLVTLYLVDAQHDIYDQRGCLSARIS